MHKRDLLRYTDTGLQLTATAAYSLLLTDDPPETATENDTRPWPDVTTRLAPTKPHTTDNEPSGADD